MSYEMTLKLRPSPSYSFLIAPTHADVVQHLVTGLGQGATLVRLAAGLDEIVVAYNPLSEDHLDAHRFVLNTVGNLAGQIARQAVQAEVVQVLRYGLQAGGAAALGALGVTSKQKGEFALFACGVAFLGGYLLGELKPMRQMVLRADWNPYRGWLVTDVPPPQLGWSPVDWGWQ